MEEIKTLFKNKKERLFQEEKMYVMVEDYARAHDCKETLSALPFAREKHQGQFRKGREHVPYIYHPLSMACHAISLGIGSDVLLSTCLLHDVLEDCDVTEEELPVSPETAAQVKLLTKPADFVKNEENQALYYGRIQESAVASMVKILDRCNNISSMSASFDAPHIIRYIEETEDYILPLIRHAFRAFPEYYYPLFALRYHMTSVLETIKHQIDRK